MSMSSWTPAYIALGSNLNDPVAQVSQAIHHLMTVLKTRVLLQSSLYRSTPIGPPDQPDFINGVVGALTLLTPAELLAELQSIEQRMGRVSPAQRWGARIIDLDILIYGELRSDTPSLQLPHPEMHKRNFVMVPLAEIAPTVTIPDYGKVADIATRLGMQGLTRLS